MLEWRARIIVPNTNNLCTPDISVHEKVGEKNYHILAICLAFLIFFFLSMRHWIFFSVNLITKSTKEKNLELVRLKKFQTASHLLFCVLPACCRPLAGKIAATAACAQSDWDLQRAGARMRTHTHTRTRLKMQFLFKRRQPRKSRARQWIRSSFTLRSKRAV